MKTSTLNLASLLAASLILASNAIADPPVRLETGHTDIGLAFEDGAWDLHIHDEANDLDYAPDEAVLVVLLNARTTVPNDPLYGFLGTPGSPVWILPQVQNPGLLFLGFGAEEIEAGVFQGDHLRVEMKSVTGPGAFVVFDVDPFGTPIPLLSSRDGVDTNDARLLPTGAHSDLNWAFTAPGLYVVEFEASGTLSDGALVSSGPVAYTFHVVGPPECPVAIARVSSSCDRPSFTNVLVVAGENDQGCVILDGTLSTDAKGDPLQYSWFADGLAAPIATGALATNCVALGEHEITLSVDDGQCLGTVTVRFEVVTGCDLIERLIDDINNSALPRNKKRPLLDSLKKICTQFERDKKNRFKNAIKKLADFQKKLRGELRHYPAARAQFTTEAQAIIDAINCAATPQTHQP